MLKYLLVAMSVVTFYNAEAIQYMQQSPAQVRSQERLLNGLEKSMNQANEAAIMQQQYDRIQQQLIEQNNRYGR